METTLVNADLLNTAKQTCIHHWIIEPPDGLESPGKCQLCGQERTFKNHFTITDWNGPDSSGAMASVAPMSAGTDEWKIPLMDDDDPSAD